MYLAARGCTSLIMVPENATTILRKTSKFLSLRTRSPKFHPNFNATFVHPNFIKKFMKFWLGPTYRGLGWEKG